MVACLVKSEVQLRMEFVLSLLPLMEKTRLSLKPPLEDISDSNILKRILPLCPHDSPLPRGHTFGSDEGRLKHDELIELVTKLSDRVVAVEEDLKQTKKTYGTALTKLVLKVKKLEKQVRSGKARRRARILIEDLGSGEKGEKEISTADVPVSTAVAEVSTATHDVSTATAALVYIRMSASKAKDKGKAIMQEHEPTMKLKKRV
ncbi:hypothetical protein Tco_0900689 [Tanacetum coccineum]